MTTSNYRTLQNFGCDSDFPTTNPYELSLYQTVNKSFNNGVLAYNYNPTNAYSQEFMAQTCAQNWNQVCEEAAKDTNPAFNSISKFSQYYGQSTTVKDVTVRNTAVEKFCDLGNCYSKVVHLNPVDSTSPLIKVYQGQCVPICSVDEKTMDTDPVMEKLLQDPMKYRDILLNIYYTKKRETGEDLRFSKTRLGEFYRTYFKSRR